MKKKLLFVINLLALTMLFGTISNIALAGTIPVGVIENWKWLGYAFNGSDAFHGASVVAYQEKSTATLSVTVNNNYGKPLNISALTVGLDWGKNYTSSMATLDELFVIPPNEKRVIPIIFTVPNLTEVSNQAQYGYTIYLEHVNSTSEPMKITSDKQFLGANFVVYSADQVDAMKTKQIVNQMQLATDPDDFNSTKAKLLWMKSENETFVAGMFYGQGDFAGAKNHYGTALSMISQAFAAEEAKGGGFDDAQVRVLEAQAKSLEASANYLNGLSNMWVLIGVAAVLFAIGYILRGLGAIRKPSVVAAT